MDPGQMYAKTICAYLEKRIEGVSSCGLIEDNDTIFLWYYDPAPYAFEVRLELDGLMNIIEDSMTQGEWFAKPAPVRAFVKAYNHIINKVVGAVVFADDLIKWEEAVKHE